MAAGVKDILIRFLGDAEPLGKEATKAEKILAGFNKAAAVAGGVAGAAMVAGLSGAFEQEDALAKLKAQAGQAPWAAAAGEAAGNLYANAYGDSLATVAEATKGVLQQGLLGGDASVAEIEGITGKVMSLAQAFDQDVTGAVNAASQMVKTGLAKNADEALDILTVGFQSGADKAGDLLDTFNEYGTQFRELGIDGASALGLLQQGLGAGARDADIVADALKEFSIRSKTATKDSLDFDQNVADAFKSLGLNAERMGKAFNRGGDVARDALIEVQAKLAGVKDPAEKGAIAVRLFGTQAEDMGEALYALDLDNAADAIGKVDGAAAAADAQLGQTASATLTSFKRSVQANLTDAMAKAIPYITGAANAIKPYLPIIVPIVAVLGGFAAAVWAVNVAMKAWTAATVVCAAVQRTMTAVALASRIAFLALNAAMRANPIGAVITALTLLVGGVILAYKKVGWFRDGVNAVWDRLRGFGSFVADLFSTVVDGVERAGRAIRDAFSSAFDAVRRAYDASGIDTIVGVIGKVGGGIGSVVGKIPGFASGGVTGRGWAMVGERGPELVNFGSPSRVLSAGATAGALGGGTVVEIHATGPTLADIVRVEVKRRERETVSAVTAGSRRALA